MAGWEALYGADGNEFEGARYNPKLNEGLASSAIRKWQGLTNTYGGAGNYGVVSDGAEGYIGVDKAAFDAVQDPSLKMTMGDFNKTNNSGWFGSGGYLSTGADVLKAGSSLLNAYTGMQQLGLAKDQFAAEQSAARTNLANQADLLNEGRANSTNVGLALAGGTMTDDQKNAARAATTAGNVSRTFN